MVTLCVEFSLSDKVWVLFRYVILHELLQDYDVAMRIDSGFHWICISVYHAKASEESNDQSLIRRLCCSSFFSVVFGFFTAIW